jgi:hypothetical protein
MPQPNFKGKPRPKTPTKTQLLRKCDALFSLIIRSRGWCENCGKPDNLQCAHGFSRRYRAVRFLEANAFSLCRGCHVYFTHRPLEWDDWLQKELANSYHLIRVKALHGPNPDLAETLTRLKARWAEIEEAA